MTNPATRAKTIVVGVDGSPMSVKALRWAVEYARQMGSEVEVLLAWQVPARSWLNLPSTDEDFIERHQRVLEKTVSEAVGDIIDVPVHQRLVEHNPAAALVSAAKGAQLLVVAARGQGVVPGIHLGRVASFCVHHAPCPVLLFREEGPPRAGIGYN